MSYQHVRSCLLDSPDWKLLDLRQIESIFKSFKLVKVLDLQKVGLFHRNTLPRAIGNLIHFRYFGIKDSWIGGLPYSISNWRFLQTLDLRTCHYGLTIPNVIWKFDQLRHLYLPSKCQATVSRRGKLRLDGLSKLETLEGFDSKYWDVKCFPTLKNLRKVSQFKVKSEDLIVILESPIFNNSYGHMQKLGIILEGDIQLQKEQELLKQLLECHHLDKLCSFGRPVQKLPDQFPINLTDLRLRDSMLEEDQMPTLEKLPNLRKLYLDWRSSIGKKYGLFCSTHPNNNNGSTHEQQWKWWRFSDQLKILALHGLLNLEEWKVVEGAMPSLFRLEIWVCTKLMEIPDGLRFITARRELDIRWPTIEFKQRLRQGGPDFYKIEHVPSVTISGRL